MHQNNSLRPHLFTNLALVIVVLVFCEGCDPFHWGLPLHNAAESGDVALAAEIIAGNPRSVNEQDILGYTPLHLAVLKGDKEMVRLLLAHGANVEIGDAQGMRPLHKAARIRNREITLMLIHQGVNINSVDRHNATALLWAVQGPPEYVELLLQYGADPSIVDDRGRSPLSEAKENLRRNPSDSYRKVLDVLSRRYESVPDLMIPPNLGTMTPSPAL